LVGERTGEEHDGDVRLPDGDRIDRVRVGGRVGELLDEAAGVVHGYGNREGVCSAGDVSSKIPRVPERCRSGRSGRSRKPLYGQPYRGFESLPLRWLFRVDPANCWKL